MHGNPLSVRKIFVRLRWMAILFYLSLTMSLSIVLRMSHNSGS